MADQWFIARNNKKFGPYSMQQLRALAAKRQLAPNDMLLKEGTAKWIAARSVKGLFADNSASVSPSTLPTARPQPTQEEKSPTSAPDGSVTWIQRQFRTHPLAVCLAGGGLFIVLACGGICSGILHMHRDSQRELTDIVNKMEEESHLKKEEAKKKVAEANQAWSSGQKEKALDQYKRLIDEDMNDMPHDEMPSICQRVIEAEMKKGNTSAAKHYIRKAREHSVELAFNDTKTKEILRRVDAELKAEERELEAELKAEERDSSESSGNEDKHADYKKLIVGKWKSVGTDLGALGDVIDEYKADGRIIIWDAKDGAVAGRGKYQLLSANKISVMISDTEFGNYTATVRISGNEMMLTFDDGKSTKHRRVR